MKPSAPLSRFGLMLGLLLAPGLQALGAPAAEPSESVAFHPCVIMGEKNKDKLQQYQNACGEEIARGSFQLVPGEQVRAVLDKEPKKSCALVKAPAECLGRLATLTHAARALLVTVHPGAPTRVSGLVVGGRGDVIDQKSIQIRGHGQPQEELVRTAVTRLREQLDIAPLKLPALVEQPKPPAVAAVPPTTTVPPATDVPVAKPPVVATPTKPPLTPSAPVTPPVTVEARREAPAGTRRTWKTPVAYTAGGLGVVGLGVAGYFAYTAEKAIVATNKMFDGGLPNASDVTHIRATQEQAKRQRVIAGASAAAGVVLLGGGVALWMMDRPAPSKPGITALGVGPGGVSLAGVLP